jgi:integrase
VEVGAIDFLRRTLRVDQQLVLLPGGEPYVAAPKTPASYRTLPLPQVVVDALATHLATGRPLRRTRFSDVWRAAAAAAGIGDGVTFHDLRHYYASLLIRHGESVKVVQKRLGHKSAVETLDTYSHLWPDSEDRTREAVDEVLGQVASRSAEEAAP